MVVRGLGKVGGLRFGRGRREGTPDRESSVRGQARPSCFLNHGVEASSWAALLSPLPQAFQQNPGLAGKSPRY